MVMLIGINTFEYMVFFEAKPDKLLQNHLVYRYLRQTYEYTASNASQIDLSKPGMLADIGDPVSSLWFSFKDAFH